MSLISEALKKARQEAARQESARQGLPYAVGAVETRDRRNPLLMALAGLGAGCVLAGAVFAAAFFGGWGPFEKARPASAPQVTQTAPTPPAGVPAEPPSAAPVMVQEEPIPPITSELPAPAPPAPEVRPVAPPPSIEIRPAAPAPVTPEPRSEPEPEPVPAAPAPAPVETAPPATPPAAASGLVEGRTYTGEVPVPGGGSVKLNGIAFSQERPVVVLDGRVMGAGEVVQGFTVVEIEAGRVKLQGHGTTVYVSPK